MKRVVVTGIGIYSCIGVNKEEVTKSLRQARCGLDIDPDRIGFRSKITGIIPKPLSTKFESEEATYMKCAMAEAVADGGKPDERFGIIIGNDGSSKANAEAIQVFSDKMETSKIGSKHIFRSLTSNPSAVMAACYNPGGVTFTVSGACASGGHVIGIAKSLIESGIEDVIYCGACQEINKESVFSFDALRAFSINDNPKEAVRPFDKDRDGLVPSGGAACLVLEELNHALNRGATIYAEICGYGASSSGSININDSQSEISCILQALGEVSPSDVDLISAHATGTIVGDEQEAKAIEAVFGSRIPIIATKALTGHEMWMAGISEIIYAILSLEADFLPSNPNTISCPYNLNVSKDIILNPKVKYFLSNSFGLGGTNSSILLKYYGKESRGKQFYS